MVVLWDELAARHSKSPFLTEFFRDLQYLSLLQGDLSQSHLADSIKMFSSKVLSSLEMNFEPGEVIWFRAMLDQPSPGTEKN